MSFCELVSSHPSAGTHIYIFIYFSAWHEMQLPAQQRETPGRRRRSRPQRTSSYCKNRQPSQLRSRCMLWIAKGKQVEFDLKPGTKHARHRPTRSSTTLSNSYLTLLLNYFKRQSDSPQKTHLFLPNPFFLSSTLQRSLSSLNLGLDLLSEVPPAQV